MTYAALWGELLEIGRDPETGGYRRYAWDDADSTLREWFVSTAQQRGLEVVTDRAGNLWAWWGDPDQDGPGLVIGSHLDSVRDGGAYDGPLGVVSSFAALDRLRAEEFVPGRPIAVVCFADEEGTRFGTACGGSRLVTGQADAQDLLARTDPDGTTMAEAMRSAGIDPAAVGRDDETLRRIGTFVELHVEQGRGLIDLGRPVAVGERIWPHGRWRFDLRGEANHAGTTRLDDRRDPTLALAALIQAARTSARTYGAVATVGRIEVVPGSVNAIPSFVRTWLDARGPLSDDVLALVADVGSAAGIEAIEESFTESTFFDPGLASRLSALLDDAPIMATGAGHDAGVLATAGIPTAMLYVRNPTGVSHSPAEHAEEADCEEGVRALATVVRDLA